ncbi:hypothetical protein GCM10010917_23100 [Paenibacillus physcomitrellae]|uniref:CobQ/CobB/MinD/ParA nucleotide binding domain-containing protein n=1 Tax=Paenibacillus physcomitrellae TaxID=1619311 RepID=A0ABQ1G5N5_9BACL|nr:hypothetical protein GCM10010917_23100 [Paenibacillus physcomitrellae]
MTVHMVLGVEDQQYVEALLDYVRSSEYGRRIRITSFSRPEAFKAFWSRLSNGTEQKVDFAAVELSFMTHVGSGNGKPKEGEEGLAIEEGGGEEQEELFQGQREGEVCLPWICLSESDSVQGGILPDIPVMTKYRPLPELLEDLLKFGREREGGVRRTPADALPEVPVIGVYASAGGTGKTTVALHLAKQLTLEGARVFYLNLKTFGLPLGLTGQRRNGLASGMAELLYELEAAAEDNKLPDLPPSRFVVRHPLIQGDTFGQVANLRELLEMEPADTVRMIDYVAGSGSYDVVIAVCDAYPDGRSTGMIDRCDRLVWLLLDDEEVLSRSAAAWEFWGKGQGQDRQAAAKLLSKTVFTLNRHSGAALCAAPRPELIPAVTLCEVPDWKQADKARILADAPAFQRDILKLRRSLFSREGNGAFPARSAGL